jgi:hypothetical protein
LPHAAPPIISLLRMLIIGNYYTGLLKACRVEKKRHEPAPFNGADNKEGIDDLTNRNRPVIVIMSAGRGVVKKPMSR